MFVARIGSDRGVVDILGVIVVRVGDVVVILGVVVVVVILGVVVNRGVVVVVFGVPLIFVSLVTVLVFSVLTRATEPEAGVDVRMVAGSDFESLTFFDS